MPLLLQVRRAGQVNGRGGGGRGRPPRSTRRALVRNAPDMSTEQHPTTPYCLVVDDEPRLRQVLVHLMKSDGFTCVEAANGEEALAHLHQHPITLVMSDLRMPKMDGLELLRQIRARWPDVAVVMI